MKNLFLTLLTCCLISITPAYAIDMEELGSDATAEIESMKNPAYAIDMEEFGGDATAEIESMETPTQESFDELKNISIQELFARGYSLKVSIAYTPGIVIFKNALYSRKFQSSNNSLCSISMKEIEKEEDRILRSERILNLHSIGGPVKDRKNYYLKASDTSVFLIIVNKVDKFLLRDVTPYSLEQDCGFLKVLEIEERDGLQDASVNTQNLNESYI